MRVIDLRHAFALILSCAALAAFAAGPGTYRMSTPIPKDITTPDTVNTRLGMLRFFDGMPDAATAQKVYDNLDFQRGVDVFLKAMPAASVLAAREGIRSAGLSGTTIGITEQLMDARSLFLTPNTETVYAMAWLDLKSGPLVVESPPNVLGIVDDFWFRYVTDLGNAGPDKGRGGKFLFLPPDYSGEPPPGYFTFKSKTYGNLIFWRGFLVDGDPRPAVEAFKKGLRIYPLSQAASPPRQRFVNLSGKPFNTVHANNFHFYEEVSRVVQEEPADFIDPDTLGLFASIGIRKGQPFAPDARMKKILTEASAVGNATARSILFASRDKGLLLYPDSYWEVAFPGGSHEFLDGSLRTIDLQPRFFYFATGITPAMARKMVGVGSQYAIAFRDAKGRYLDGGKSYRLRIPANAPAKDFWSIVVYDGQTRSLLQTDADFPSIGSQKKGLTANADGSVDVYFGPKAPKGMEANWVQTVPGKSWNTILRLYGPLEAWFDKSWRPGDIEPM